MITPKPDNERLAVIETTLVQLVKQLDVTLPSHDARLTRVERVMWLALGMALASGVPDYVRLLA